MRTRLFAYVTFTAAVSVAAVLTVVATSYASTADTVVETMAVTATENPTGLAEDPITGEDVDLKADAPLPYVGAALASSWTCTIYPDDPYFVAAGFIGASALQSCSGAYGVNQVTVFLQKKVIRRFFPDSWETVKQSTVSTTRPDATASVTYQCPGTKDTKYRMLGRGETQGSTAYVRSREVLYKTCG